MSRITRPVLVALVTSLLLIGAAAGATAYDSVDQSMETGHPGPCLTPGYNYAMGQSFTPTVDTVTAVDVRLMVYRPSGGHVRLMVGGPSGGVLANAYNVAFVDGWNHIEFATPIDVVPGNTYGIRIDLTYGNPCWWVDYSVPYAGGMGWYVLGGYVGNWDLGFRTYFGLPDMDDDGIVDAADNCPTVWNADQADFDLDGFGDVCDDDVDGDGALNDADVCPFTMLPEPEPPKWLKNHYVANVDGDFVDPDGKLAGMGVTDTGGCTGAQVIDLFDLGKGHVKHGITLGALLDWTAQL